MCFRRLRRVRLPSVAWWRVRTRLCRYVGRQQAAASQQRHQVFNLSDGRRGSGVGPASFVGREEFRVHGVRLHKQLPSGVWDRRACCQAAVHRRQRPAIPPNTTQSGGRRLDESGGGGELRHECFGLVERAPGHGLQQQRLTPVVALEV